MGLKKQQEAGEYRKRKWYTIELGKSKFRMFCLVGIGFYGNTDDQFKKNDSASKHSDCQEKALD
jgi:hypothetical protein